MTKDEEESMIHVRNSETAERCPSFTACTFAESSTAFVVGVWRVKV